MVVIYSAIVPLILPAGVLFFVLLYSVDKYVLEHGDAVAAR